MSLTFKPPPIEFHDKLRKLITTRVPCHLCKNPQCSCSGAHKAEVVFIPGEREWSEHHLHKQFPNNQCLSFMIQGDCPMLEGHICTAGYFRPWDDYSFPLQPILEEGKLKFIWADNCSLIHKLSNQWLKERQAGWYLIEKVIDRRWLEFYCAIPIHT